MQMSQASSLCVNVSSPSVRPAQNPTQSSFANAKDCWGQSKTKQSKGMDQSVNGSQLVIRNIPNNMGCERTPAQSLCASQNSQHQKQKHTESLISLHESVCTDLELPVTKLFTSTSSLTAYRWQDKPKLLLLLLLLLHAMAVSTCSYPGSANRPPSLRL